MWGMLDERYSRSCSLLGDKTFEELSSLHVAIFGVGGVGGWCCEALLRTGVRHLSIIDDDIVAESNINRQRQATPNNIGKPKVEVLRDILLNIIPDAKIDTITRRYTPENSGDFKDLLDTCDFVIDAIDSVDCKSHLIRQCTESGNGRPISIFSSMGAALRTDPTKVRVAPFHKITGDGLAKALRNRFRKADIPLPKHLCVYSEELPAGIQSTAKGSIMPVTCTFGMSLASLVIQAASQS